MPSRKVQVAVSIGNLIEIYDLLIYGYFATTLAGQFFPPGDPAAALLKTLALYAVGYVVRPVGAIVFGHVGDRFGRRAALAGSLLLMTVATAAFGLLPTYAAAGSLAPALLVGCRLLQGLSVSAEVPGSMLLMVEHAPPGRRGRIAAVNSVAGTAGTLLAAAVALTLAASLSPGQVAAWGWRAAFLAAVPIGIVGVYVRTRLPDSPALTAAEGEPWAAPVGRAVATAKRGMLVLLVWFGTQSIGSYVVAGLMPSYLIRSVGLTATETYAVSLTAVGVSGLFTLLGGYLLDRFPARPVAIAAMAGVAAAAVPGFLVIATFRTPVAAVAGQLMFGAFLGTAFIAGTLLVMGLFPARIRFTAFALPLSIGNSLLGSTAPYVSTWLTVALDDPLAPGFYLLAAAALGTLVMVAGLPRRYAEDVTTSRTHR